MNNSIWNSNHQHLGSLLTLGVITSLLFAGCGAPEPAEPADAGTLAPLCGDGALDPGEICDGDCPIEWACDDGDSCTTETFTGNPDTCDAVCEHQRIFQCVPNDGCCPSVACVGLDNDCVPAEGEECITGQSVTQECGFNGNGTHGRNCVDGAWEEWGPCEDTDVCTNGGTQAGSTPCGSNSDGTLIQECVEGQWVDKDAVEVANCDGDMGDCTNGTTGTGTTPCGLNDEGFLRQECVEGQWVDKDAADVASCDGASDVCINGTFVAGTTSCGINLEGFLIQDCTGGEWVEGTDCSGTDNCVNGSPDVSEACGPGNSGTQTRICADGNWTAWTTCSTCDAGAKDTEPCGLNNAGTRDRWCIGAAGWGAWGSCTDPDICTNSSTTSRACGPNLNGTGIASCVNGQWGVPATCSGADDCQDGNERSGATDCTTDAQLPGRLRQLCTGGLWVDKDSSIDSNCEPTGGMYNTCLCTNGTGVTGPECVTPNGQYCTACDLGYDFDAATPQACAKKACQSTEAPNSTSYTVTGSISGGTGDSTQVTCAAGSSGGGLWVCAPSGSFSGLACTPCEAGEYAAGTGNASCSPHHQCSSGEQVATPGSSTTNTTCEEQTCGAMQYRASGQSCRDWKVCSGTEYETDAPTVTSDRQCTALTTCTEAEYMSSAPTVTSDRQCRALTTCAIGQGKYNHTASSDGSCVACNDTGNSTTNQFSAAADTSACVAHTLCGLGKGATTAGTASNDATCVDCNGTSHYNDANDITTACLALSICTEAEYMSSAPTVTTDRQCSALTDCAAGQYVSAPPTATSNRDCTSCDSMHYSSTVNSTDCTSCPPGSTSSPTRVSCDSVCGAGTYFASNGTCQNWRVCSSSEYESGAPSDVADRECTACDNGYEVIDGSCAKIACNPKMVANASANVDLVAAAKAASAQADWNDILWTNSPSAAYGSLKGLIDGVYTDLDDYSLGGQMFHSGTPHSSGENYVAVDLTASRYVESITVINRSGVCGGRLDQTQVWTSNADDCLAGIATGGHPGGNGYTVHGNLGYGAQETQAVGTSARCVLLSDYTAVNPYGSCGGDVTMNIPELQITGQAGGPLNGKTGEEVAVHCNEGYRGNGAIVTWTCGANGSSAGSFTGAACESEVCSTTQVTNADAWFVNEGDESFMGDPDFMSYLEMKDLLFGFDSVFLDGIPFDGDWGMGIQWGGTGSVVNVACSSGYGGGGFWECYGDGEWRGPSCAACTGDKFTYSPNPGGACVSCSGGKHADASHTGCEDNVCSGCVNGTAARGTACGTDGGTTCTACEDGYALSGGACVSLTPEGSIRLAGTGSTDSKGRVEIYHNGQWGTVCNDGDFQNNIGNAGGVICKMLGFGYLVSHGSSQGPGSNPFGDGAGVINLDDLACNGTENSVLECSYRWHNDTNCGHNEDVAVECSATPPSGCSDTEYDLGSGNCIPTADCIDACGAPCDFVCETIPCEDLRYLCVGPKLDTILDCAGCW